MAEERVPVLETKCLGIQFGGLKAVNDVNIEIYPGELIGLIGPNGAGKSTTMNMITGYIASTEGKVMIDGHDILEEPEAAKKCIGYLPEIPPLYMEMTVREYLEIAAELKGIKKDKRESHLEEFI